jgi:hypothetical protein
MEFKRLVPLLAIVVSLFWFAANAKTASSSCIVAEVTGPASITVSFTAGHTYSLKISSPATQIFETASSSYTETAFIPAGVYVAVLDESVDCAQGFNPGDARINGQPGDRLAVYCNNTANPKNLGVILVDNKGKGFSELKFNYDALKAAGQSGVTTKDGLGNTVQAFMTGNNTFYVAWTAGQYGANGVDIFAKAAGCIFQ